MIHINSSPVQCCSILVRIRVNLMGFQKVDLIFQAWNRVLPKNIVEQDPNEVIR